MNILDQIIAAKRIEVAERKDTCTTTELSKSPEFKEPCRSLKKALLLPHSSGIIAEFKRKSPSLGWISENADVKAVTSGYAEVGAACLSVLTDNLFFGGTMQDLRTARRAAYNTPILRKDFVIDEYQLLEAKAVGADVVLLIAECLTKKEVNALANTAYNLGLEVLMELHSEEELEKVSDFVTAVGVNNRNLKTFEVSLDASRHISALIPSNFLKIAESGISAAESINELRHEYGFQGFLIGEAFMKTANPSQALANFIQHLK